MLLERQCVAVKSPPRAVSDYKVVALPPIRDQSLLLVEVLHNSSSSPFSAFLVDRLSVGEPVSICSLAAGGFIWHRAAPSNTKNNIRNIL
ncbi:hypothetical protein AVEN_124764-1 [Araneus ventricosus]|uniref:Uncharacterized protein n=1 Tax=Araneus ventricosus TaxID=182803 RepID=A0A4Y2KJC8_ARAVE|nr:hypothetical protein AVEN_124764-1 [Araneus ventricosus]